MKKIEFDLKNNPFINFQSARYSVSARMNVKTCGSGVMKTINLFLL